MSKLSNREVSLPRWRQVILFPILASLLFLGVACDKTPNEPILSDNPNTSDEFGGYTATNEAPSFGSSEIMSLEVEESGIEISDPLLTSSDVIEIMDDPEARRYALRIVWGKLRGDSTVVAATDWSGSLTINRGAEVVRRLIRFEPNQDYLLPRTDRRLIEWVSETTVHNDGMLVEIFNPLRPDSVSFDTTFAFATDTVISEAGDTTLVIRDVIIIDTVVFDSPLELTFTTEPLTISFTGAELMALDTVIYLQDSCAVLFQSTRIDSRMCPKGYLAGEWGVDDEGRGQFRGVWMNNQGEPGGHLQGHWGLNDEGRRMFWGKWISLDGRFEGFLRGGWEPHPNEHASDVAFAAAGGMFKGHIFDASRRKIGFLRGRWGHGDEGRHGIFAGKWKLRCPPPPGARETHEPGEMDRPEDDF